MYWPGSYNKSAVQLWRQYMYSERTVYSLYPGDCSYWRASSTICATTCDSSHWTPRNGPYDDHNEHEHNFDERRSL